MPICYKIDPQINLIFLMARGHCTASELFSFDAETWNHPLRKSNMRIMINLLDCDLDVDMKGIKNAISRNRELNSTGWELEKTAIVTHSFLLETFSKTYELMANDLPVKITVFHSRDVSSPLRMPVESASRTTGKSASLADSRHAFNRPCLSASSK